MVWLQQPLSTRAVLAHTPMFVQSNGDSDEAEEPFFLPTNGTEGRVVRGTKCGGPNDSSACSNSPAPAPDAAQLGDLSKNHQGPSKFPIEATVLLVMVPVMLVASLLICCYAVAAYRRHRTALRRQQADTAALAFLAAMEARGTPMPPSQPVTAAPTGVPCLCVQPDKNIVLAMHEIALLSTATEVLGLPESGMASTLVSIARRNDVILEDYEGLTPPNLHDAHQRNSIDSSSSQAIPRAAGAASDTDPADIPVLAALRGSMVWSPLPAPMRLAPTSGNSPDPTSMRSAGSGRGGINHTPEGLTLDHIDIVPPSMHHSSRHRNPYAFMLDRGLQDPSHWNRDGLASGSVRGLLNLGATLLSSRGNVPNWQQDALEWAAVEVPVYYAYITADAAKWLMSRSAGSGSTRLTAGLLAVFTGGNKPSSVRSTPSWNLGSVSSIVSRSLSHNGVNRVSLPLSIGQRARSLGAAANRPICRAGSPTSWNTAAASSPGLLSSGSVRSNSGVVTSGPSYAYQLTNRRPNSEENRLQRSQGVAEVGAWPLPVSPLLTRDKVLRMSDLRDYGDDQQHIPRGQWVPPPPVVARGLHCGMEVPWSELSLLPPEGMVPVSVVASGAVSQPWLHNSSDSAVVGGPASQGRSMCGMATVFESIGSGCSESDTLESLRGRSEHTMQTANSGPCCQAGNAIASHSSGNTSAKGSTHSLQSPMDTPTRSCCAAAATTRMGPSAPAAAVQLAVRDPANSARQPQRTSAAPGFERSGSGPVLGDLNRQPSQAASECAQSHLSHTQVREDEFTDCSSSAGGALDSDAGTTGNSHTCAESTAGGVILNSEPSSTTHPFLTAAEDLPMCGGEAVGECVVFEAADQSRTGEAFAIEDIRGRRISTGSQSYPPDCVLTLSSTTLI